MEHVISPNVLKNLPGTAGYHKETGAKAGVLKKFFDWCADQEKNRFLWLGLGLMGHIGTLVPLTLLAILFLGNNYLGLWIVALSVNVPVLIVNLADQPTRVIVPVMLTSVAVNVTLIVSSFIIYFV